MANGHGGHREGSGRKSKADEQKLIERLTPLQDDAFDALHNGLNKKAPWAVKLYFEYMYGKPKQSIDHTSDGEKINIPISKWQ